MGKPRVRRHLTATRLALATLIVGMLAAAAWNGPGAVVPCRVLAAAPATTFGMYHAHGPYPRQIFEISGLGRYRYDWWGCYSTYLPWASRSGWYSRDGDVLRLRSLTLCTYPPFIEPDPVLVRIRWGPREYLVSGLDPDGAYRCFIRAVKDGDEPRNAACGRSPIYLREGDWTRPASGMPDLPAQWRNDFAAARAAALTATASPSATSRCAPATGARPSRSSTSDRG